MNDVRIVELASFVAAPAAGALLADLGAEVIKVEVPWGEIYRHSLPRYAGYESDFGLSPHFQMDNRGKRSVALDLALPEAVTALQRIVAGADAMLTNMLPARLEKYGVDPESLHRRHPTSPPTPRPCSARLASPRTRSRCSSQPPRADGGTFENGVTNRRVVRDCLVDEILEEADLVDPLPVHGLDQMSILRRIWPREIAARPTRWMARAKAAVRMSVLCSLAIARTSE